jgi:hypothetical protein
MKVSTFLGRSAFALLVVLASTATAQTPAPRFDGANGMVTAIARWGNTIFIGGNFTAVGPVTGGGVPVTLGAGETLHQYPQVTGTVTAVASDGRGGWYIGGSFVAVGGLPRHNLAHIAASGRVTRWDPSPDGNAITCLAVDGRTIYVSGDFTHVGDRARRHAAALDAESGTSQRWNPAPNGSIRALVTDGRVVYVGGEFDSIGGLPQRHLAMLDRRGGAVLERSADADGPVYALGVVDNTVYAGGKFSELGGKKRGSIAAFDARSGETTNWNPGVGSDIDSSSSGPPATVLALRATQSQVFIGGNFLRAGGELRGGIAAIDRVSGVATAWDPNPIPNQRNVLYFGFEVDALTLVGHQVLIGGTFGALQLGGPHRHYLEGLDIETGNVTDWNPKPNGPVAALAADDQTVYVGGSFVGLGDWQRRAGLAALDATTGAVTPWIPYYGYGYIGQVNTLAAAANQIYLGGYYSLGLGPTTGLASFDVGTGMQTHPDLIASLPDVFDLLANGNTLFACGDYDSIGGEPSVGLSILDASTGRATQWYPEIKGGVRAMALGHGALYVAGWFTTIDGMPRRGLAAFDTLTWSLTPWNPDADNPVTVLSGDDETIFAAGGFGSIGGQPRHYLGAIDARTGAVTGWDPRPIVDPQSPYAPVLALATQPGVVYVGGSFTGIGSQPRRFLAAVDPTSGTPTDWNPDLDGNVQALLTDGTTLYVGGDFNRSGLTLAAHFAAIPLDRPIRKPGRVDLASGLALPGLALRVPNPARGASSVDFTLPESEPVTLEIYDLQGRRVTALLDHSMQSAGTHEIELRTSSWAAGVYLCRLEAGGASLTRKFVVLR